MISKFLFVGLLTLAPAASAVEVFVMDIPGVHVQDGSGVYDKVIAQVPGTKLTVESVKRAFVRFEQCPNCCLSPVNKNPEFYTYTSDAYSASKPLNLAKVYIFSPPGKPVVTDLAALKGKKVGARLGMPYGKTVENAGLKIDLVNTDIQNINLLKVNRLDYMIAYTPDAYDAFDSLKMEPLPHDKNKPVNVHEDSVLCKNTPENKAFLDKLNAVIK